MKITSVQTTSKFKRSFSKLPKSVQKQAIKKIAIFRDNPKDSSLKTHKLKGKLSHIWSFSVNYSYRIIFTYPKKDIILLQDIGDHRIYQ